jgi:predicted ester cyclase
MADNLTLVRSLYDGWNNRDFDVLADATALDGTITFMGSGEVLKGPEGSRVYSEMWASGFPDGRVTIDSIVADGDRVVVEFTGRGTHTGTFVTSMGEIPPTGKSVTLKMCDVLELAEGKIRAQRSYLDTGSMMVQLGLISGQTATANQ